MILLCAVAMKLAGSYHLFLLLGEDVGGEENLEAQSLLEVLPLLAILPSESTAPGRVILRLGGAFPFRQVLASLHPSSQLIGATPFRVVLG